MMPRRHAFNPAVRRHARTTPRPTAVGRLAKTEAAVDGPRQLRRGCFQRATKRTPSSRARREPLARVPLSDAHSSHASPKDGDRSWPNADRLMRGRRLVPRAPSAPMSTLPPVWRRRSTGKCDLSPLGRILNESPVTMARERTRIPARPSVRRARRCRTRPSSSASSCSKSPGRLALRPGRVASLARGRSALAATAASVQDQADSSYRGRSLPSATALAAAARRIASISSASNPAIIRRC